MPHDLMWSINMLIGAGSTAVFNRGQREYGEGSAGERVGQWVLRSS